jgi:hypothetical protein
MLERHERYAITLPPPRETGGGGGGFSGNFIKESVYAAAFSRDRLFRATASPIIPVSPIP